MVAVGTDRDENAHDDPIDGRRDDIGAPLTRAQIRNPNVGPQYLRFKRYRREPFAPLKITI